MLTARRLRLRHVALPGPRRLCLRQGKRRLRGEGLACGRGSAVCAARVLPAVGEVLFARRGSCLRQEKRPVCAAVPSEWG